jgi:hypothetical protein
MLLSKATIEGCITKASKLTKIPTTTSTTTTPTPGKPSLFSKYKKMFNNAKKSIQDAGNLIASNTGMC